MRAQISEPVARRRPAPTTLYDAVSTVGLVNNVANIIMQLSLPPVGEGVSESRVVSGSPRRRPIKRARTTGQFLALALLGTEKDRAAMRAAIAAVHSKVVSTPGSAVGYSGNSPALQLWVAAALFRYYLDQYTLLYGPLTEPELDVLTRSAEPLATGVNVRPGTWPQTWAAFDEYWNSQLPHLSISPEVKRDFESLSDLTFMREAWGTFGTLLGWPFRKSFRFLTRGSLPPYFRDLMGWSWSERDEAKFQRSLTWIRRLDRLGNRHVMRFSYRIYVFDFRLRRRLGLPVLGKLRTSKEMIRDGGGMKWFGRRPRPTP